MPSAPGPRGHVLFGSYRDLQHDPLGFFVRCNREYGHIFRFTPFPAASWHFVSHPDHLEHLLLRQYTNYPKGIFARLNSLAAGEGLVSLDGEPWRRERKLLLPAFHGGRLAGMAQVISRATDEMLDGWRGPAAEPRNVDLVQELMAATLGIAGRIICGQDLGGTAPVFGPAFRETLAYLDYRLVHPFALPLAAPTRRNIRYRRAVARLNAIIEPLIRARRAAGVDAGDVLSALLGARDETGAPIDDVQIREEMKTLLTAGHETTAAAVFWSVYSLARHPEYESRLHAEVDALEGLPTVENLSRLPFTRMVIEESLRLYPTIVWGGRVAAEADEIGGFTIPAGSHVVFSMYVTHRHPDFWVRPDAFEPDRFSAESVAARRRNVYLPFGLGPRHCIGDRLGMMETTMILAMICRRYRMRLVERETVAPQLLATLRPPAGVLLRAEPR